MKKLFLFFSIAGLIFIVLLWYQNHISSIKKIATLNKPSHNILISTPTPQMSDQKKLERQNLEIDRSAKGWSQFKSREHQKFQATNKIDLNNILKSKKAYFKKLPKTEIKLNNKTYWLINNIYARSLIQNTNSQISSNLSDEDLQFLPEKIGPYILTRDHTNKRTLSVNGIEGDKEFPVVLLDEINGTVGIINGEIAFFKKPEVSYDYFTQVFSLIFVQAYGGSLKQRAAFQVPPGQNIFGVVKKLEENNNIDHQHSIEVDITTRVLAGT
jgi:hypothetical protein